MPCRPASSFPTCLFGLFILSTMSFGVHAQGIPCFGDTSNGEFSLSVEVVADNIGPVTSILG